MASHLTVKISRCMGKKVFHTQAVDMPAFQGMRIAVIASRQGGRVYTSKLLRQSYRKDGKVQKRTLANLSHLDDRAIALLRGHLKGRAFVEATGGGVEILGSRSHGAVAAVTGAFRELGFQNPIASRPSRQRDLVCAMVAGRIIRPHTELATTRWWHTSTLARTFGVEDAGVDEPYRAMDWLPERQNRIQGKLARRLFRERGLALYDLGPTCVEGERCPLARRGHNRDGRKGKLQVNFGLLCDVRGRPAAVSVHPGNTGDTRTILPEVERLRKRFGLARVVPVGDRGMIVRTTIDALRPLDGLDWISALKGTSVAKLMRRGALGGLDAVNLFELFHPDFPGERLVACRNPRPARRRARARKSLLEATEIQLEKLAARVAGGRPRGAAETGLAVGGVINRHRMGKHFAVTVTDTGFVFARRQGTVAAEAALDGVYVIRASLPDDAMTAGDCVRSYKALTRVERAFRTIRTVNLKVRPTHHRTEARVRAHIFLRALAWYVERHMREAWRPPLFRDTELEEGAGTRDPVAPARRSESARRKASRAALDDGTPVHRFRTLIETLEAMTVNRCRIGTPDPDAPAATFEVTTRANPTQQRALDLIDEIARLSQPAPRL